MQKLNNAILELALQLRERTYGMCRVGPGPYGFGICNTNPADIAIVLRATPNPFEDKVLTQDAKEITLAVEGFFKNNPTETLDRNTALRLSAGSDAATRVVAAAFIELSQTPLTVSKAECVAAFDYMAKQEIAGTVGLTGEEMQKIADTRWYETKTAQEIAGFQLYEQYLCMPDAKFREALETVLGRPIMEDECLFDNQALQAEYQDHKNKMLLPPMTDGDMNTAVELGMGGINM